MTAADRMSSPDDPTGGVLDALSVVLMHLAHAEQQLLGRTIDVSDEQWRAPSRLSGWTRGHVATHLARNAEAMQRIAEGALHDKAATMYDSDAARDGAIDAGAGRTGLALQTDMDTTAGALRATLDEMAAADRWDALVTARDGTTFPARLIPLGRLTEVVLHHIDLDLGTDVDDIEAEVASWVLEWLAFRLGNRVERPFHVGADSTSPRQIGIGDAQQGDPVVQGSPQALVGWLSGRTRGTDLDGVGDLTPPAL